MDAIYCKDDTGAFGRSLLTVELENADGLNITKAEFRCGKILKTFTQPTFPLKINLTCEETELLTHSNSDKLVTINPGYLAIYDEEGLKWTLEGSVDIAVRKCVV